jgi:hypothetical protein
MNRTESRGACPDCQAEVPSGSKFCWLCGARISSKGTPADARTAAGAEVPIKDKPAPAASSIWIEDDFPAAQQQSVGRSRAKISAHAALFTLTGLMVLVVAGVYAENAGVGVLLGLLFLPPLFWTCVKAALRPPIREAVAEEGENETRISDPANHSHAPMSPTEMTGSCLRGVMVMFGVLGLLVIVAVVLIVSAIIALLQACGIKW